MSENTSNKIKELYPFLHGDKKDALQILHLSLILPLGQLQNCKQGRADQQGRVNQAAK